VALTSDAELGTGNPCGRNGTFNCLQPAGHHLAQNKISKFNVLGIVGEYGRRQSLRRPGIFCPAIGNSPIFQRKSQRGAAAGRCL
jgi:hypothetical protein